MWSCCCSSTENWTLYGWRCCYEYDENQNLIKATDNQGREILYTNDDRNNLLEEKTKISVGRWKTESFTYDAFGRVLSKTDAEGNTTRYEYDLGDNLDGKIGKDHIKVITNSGYEYEYTYDDVGRNTEIKTDYGTIEFGYNNLDYVVKIKDANENVVKHISPEYYSAETDDGLGYSYTYDSLNRLKEVINEEGKVEKTFKYDFSGNIIKETDIDGISTLYKYDLIGNLIKKKTPVEYESKRREE